MKIYNLGSMNIDYVYRVPHFLQPGETLASGSLEIFPGGKGLNQSVALGRAGAQVIHGAFVGTGGEFLVRTLAESAVDVSRIRPVEASPGHAIIQVDSTGQNCILLYAGTNRMVDTDYIESFLADAEPGDILLLQNESSCLREAMELGREKGMQIAFNPSPFHASILELPLEAVDWWFCNEIEGAALFGSGTPEAIADRFVRKYPGKHLILTLGGEGSLYARDTVRLRQEIYPAKAVDTTAAGDTFTGFFLASFACGRSAAEALDTASRAASVTVSRMGAAASIPYMAEVI